MFETVKNGENLIDVSLAEAIEIEQVSELGKDGVGIVKWLL